MNVSDPHRTVIDVLDIPASGGGAVHVAEVLEAYFESEYVDPAEVDGVRRPARSGNGVQASRLSGGAKRDDRRRICRTLPFSNHRGYQQDRAGPTFHRSDRLALEPTRERGPTRLRGPDRSMIGKVDLIERVRAWGLREEVVEKEASGMLTDQVATDPAGIRRYCHFETSCATS